MQVSTISNPGNATTTSVTFTFTYYIDTSSKFIAGTISNALTVLNTHDTLRIIYEKQKILDKVVFDISHGNTINLGNFNFSSQDKSTDNKPVYDVKLS